MKRARMSCRDDVERYASHSKKAEIVNYAVRRIDEKDVEIDVLQERLGKLESEAEKWRELREVKRAVDAVIRAKGELAGKDGVIDDVIGEILRNCEQICDHVSDYDEHEREVAVLCRLLGMTEQDWDLVRNKYL